MPEELAFYNPIGPEPPTHPFLPEEITPGLFFADLFSSTRLRTRDIQRRRRAKLRRFLPTRCRVRLH
jgi:hypothetical protein